MSNENVCMYAIKVKGFQHICGNDMSPNRSGTCKHYCELKGDEYYWREDVY